MHAEALGLTSSADSFRSDRRCLEACRAQRLEDELSAADESLACFDGGTRALIVHVKRGLPDDGLEPRLDLRGSAVGADAPMGRGYGGARPTQPRPRRDNAKATSDNRESSCPNRR